MFFTKKDSSNLPWKMLFIEAFLVVLSVLLALALNSWRQAQSNEQIATRAVQEFVDEIDMNCSNILATQTYHKAVVEGEHKPEGIQIGLLRNDAWNVANTIGATPHINYSIVSKMGNINSRQSDHRTIVQSYLQALFDIALQTEQPGQLHREGEKFIISDLMGIQTDLQEDYKKFLALVRDNYGSEVEISGACK